MSRNVAIFFSKSVGIAYFSQLFPHAEERIVDKKGYSGADVCKVACLDSAQTA